MAARHHIALLAIFAALCWHGLAIGQHWRDALRVAGANDFASYYYAAVVAQEGGDPYAKGSLGAAARGEDTRKGVHPFFYPPPFLLGMAWAPAMPLHDAYLLWFWLDELMAVAALVVLWRAWGSLGSTVGPVLLVSGALLTAIPNNHVMGQANLPVLLLVVCALALEGGCARRDALAGVLMGAACMAKMSPALFVAWWLLRRRFVAAAAACAAAVALSVLALPLVGPWVQVRFYTEVLPTFSDGSYNGLGVGLDLFGNHALPNLYDAWFPAPGGGHLRLSDTARVLSGATMLGLVALTAWVFRGGAPDLWARAAQAGAIAALMLMVPAITYEHHLVWLLPSAVVAVAAIDHGRLSGMWVLPVGLALGAWCFDLAVLKGIHAALKPGWPWLAFAVQEAKMGSVIVLYAANLVAGRTR